MNTPIIPAARRIRTGLAVVCAGFLVLLTAPIASAHATLLFATPVVQGAVPTAPTSLSLVFDEPVTLTRHTLELAGPGGRAEQLGPVMREQGNSELTAGVEEPLKAGLYTVTWEVISEDGDDVTGTYQFAIGPATALLAASSGQNRATPGQGPTTAARWIVFAALAILLGELWGRWLTRRPPRAWSGPAGVAGLVGSVALALLLMGAGNLATAVTSPDIAVLTGRPGILALIEVAAFLTATLARRRPRVLMVASAAVIVAEALRAHPDNYDPTLGVIVTIVHLTAAGLWVGGLLFVVRTRLQRTDSPESARAVTRRYARTALWLLAAVLVSGVLSALIVLPLSKIFSTGYGQLLIAKLVLVAIAIALAAFGRFSLSRERDSALTLGTRVETVVLACILVVASLLTTAPPARTTDTALPFAPPATGSVVPVGGRAGQIGIYAEASAGQLVVHLSAPDVSVDSQGSTFGGSGVLTPGGTGTDYQLSATLAEPSGTVSTLSLVGCGEGCFVAQHVDWKTGSSQVTFHVGASTADGGIASVSVPWPAHPDQTTLPRVVARMRAVPSFGLNERSTSDTTKSNSLVTAGYTLSGPALLASDPYSSGKASIVDALALSDGDTELLLGYTSADIAIQLVVKPDGTIVRENLEVPDEIIYRAFRYPEH